MEHCNLCQIIQTSQARLDPIILFIGKCVENIANLAAYQNPNIINYINIGFKIKENLNQVFKYEPYYYFLNQDWETFGSGDLWPLIEKIISSSFKDKIKAINSSNSAINIYVAELDSGIKIGWYGVLSSVDCMFVSTGQLATAKKNN